MPRPSPVWVVPEAFRRLTPNRYHRGHLARRIEPIEFIVYHYTAGSFDGSLRWLTSRDSRVSAHFLVKKNGEIWQMAPLDDRTWHAGGQTSRWREAGRVNNRSIGIEIENWGPLKARRRGSTTEVLTYRDLPYSGDVFEAADTQIWDAYPEDQIAAVEDLTRRLVEKLPQLREADGGVSGPPDGRLIGHQHVDPTRKQDPGPAFPWARILLAAESPDGVVTGAPRPAGCKLEG